VDAEKMLLCTKKENKSIIELVFQYHHAPLYLDRYEALEGLYKAAKDSLATKTIIEVLNDKNWSLRLDAISLLTDIQSGNEIQLKEKLKAIAQKDEKSIVRAAAIDFLSANIKDENLQTLYRNALNEKSYTVISSALSAISKINQKEGLSLAKQYESEKNNDVLYTIADIYSNYGSDENNAFFLNSAEKYVGFSKISFITQYQAFLKNAKKDETVNSGVNLFETITKDPATNKWVYYYAKKAINDLAMMYDERANVYSQKLKLITDGNPNAAGTKELQSQIENAKAQKQKILEIFATIK
jgi:aminopeptidase N